MHGWGRLGDMKRWEIIPVALVAFVCLESCVGPKKILISTDPAGARVSINGVPQEKVTPVEVTVDQSKDLGIVVEKDAYETATRVVYTRTNWWLSLLWTKTNPRARFIEENEVHIPLKKIPTVSTYVPTPLPPYGGEHARPAAPPLRAMPNNL